MLEAPAVSAFQQAWPLSTQIGTDRAITVGFRLYPYPPRPQRLLPARRRTASGSVAAATCRANHACNWARVVAAGRIRLPPTQPAWCGRSAPVQRVPRVISSALAKSRRPSAERSAVQEGRCRLSRPGPRAATRFCRPLKRTPISATAGSTSTPVLSNKLLVTVRRPRGWLPVAGHVPRRSPPHRPHSRAKRVSTPAASCPSPPPPNHSCLTILRGYDIYGGAETAVETAASTRRAYCPDACRCRSDRLAHSPDRTRQAVRQRDGHQ